MPSISPVMSPRPGERLVRFVGDSIAFKTACSPLDGNSQIAKAVLRTNIGRAKLLRKEIIEAHTHGLPLAGGSWRDLPMSWNGEAWSIELPLGEPGFFRAKAYLVDKEGWQHWPEGADFGVSVHPNAYRTGNTIYCAFTRLFGPTKGGNGPADPKQEGILSGLEKQGYAVLPPSGTLRDLKAQLPHIVGTLGCRILHLLPVNPTPTTYARFGRFGSPYAALDLTAIDPALVVFDKRTTGIDQFKELAYATHNLGARLFLDIVINHTGWGSTLQENHPESFLRNPDGTFASPGAWGTTWEDLVELKHDSVELWDRLASMFVTWCRRGVDGFRCDAGYKVPVPAWQYIVNKVQNEFPNTIFLLEGLGGAWEATAALLTDGGMQWAYSELFQNYSARDVTSYLNHSIKGSESVGLLVHYSETHDNDRLAQKGRGWTLLRNRLCALTSPSGGFGFTCGVEWLAKEKVKVHGSPALNWEGNENIIPELATLNRLLSEHPCFFDSATVRVLNSVEDAAVVVLRVSAERKDAVLVLINPDTSKPATASIQFSKIREAFPGNVTTEVETWSDLLGQPTLTVKKQGKIAVEITLPPGAAYCLSPTRQPSGLAGDAYRRVRGLAAFGAEAMAAAVPTRKIPIMHWQQVARLVEAEPVRFLATVSRLAEPGAAAMSEEEFADLTLAPGYPRVIVWTERDAKKITCVPANHWLLIRLSDRFRARLTLEEGNAETAESTDSSAGHIAFFAPRLAAGEAKLELEGYGTAVHQLTGAVRFLSATARDREVHPKAEDILLLTNGRGGMARMCVDLGKIQSKYDCVLGANLHPTLPVDRHILAKRIRVWVNADGFISPLDFGCLASFSRTVHSGTWDFVANAGDGRTVEIKVSATMPAGQNAVLFQFTRPTEATATGKQLPAEADVRLTVRLDIEDRSFHCETKHNAGADYHFTSNLHPVFAESASGTKKAQSGFIFTPAADRQLRVFSSAGVYHSQPEWSHNIPHPVEQTRGQEGYGDAFSPGWFDLPIRKGDELTLTVTAEQSQNLGVEGVALSRGTDTGSSFESRLQTAASAFVVRRGNGKSVIAGYPWFLDWGRDTFICARGLIAAGMVEEVKQIAITFARFQDRGTLPNTIFGEDASNRDTSDAPLWFGVVCEEIANLEGHSFYATKVGKGEATIADTLWDIAIHYVNGTPNGIKMDPASALIWSPSHFTWMDTNYPAGTPRQGFPVEIQALWIRLLRQLEIVGSRVERRGWDKLANQALESVQKFFWREQKGWYADVLSCGAGTPASAATVDDCLRSNALFLVSLGIVNGIPAQRAVGVSAQYLVVPGALRSLAPLPVTTPLPVLGSHGGPLNDPMNPYWPRYEGDEDTRRKPAYHNGTAWCWTFPSFCEALARAWDFSPAAVAAARSYLASVESHLDTGCLGQLPEILDGDAPHTQRGCDAQAWSVTEALRVWKELNRLQQNVVA